MSTPANSVEVTIFNTPYVLSQLADPQAPDVRELAAYVDAKMLDVSERAGLVSSTKVAVLTALEIAQELFELRHVVENESDTVNSRLADLVRTIDEAL